MKRVHAELLIHLSNSSGFNFGFNKGVSQTSHTHSVRYGSNPEYYEKAETLCREAGLNLSAITANKIAALMKTSGVLDGTQYEQFVEQAQHLSERLRDEMENFMYFAIEPDKQYLLKENNQFGDIVTRTFPNATWDIQEAANCLAFERWTAAVFHLMRVAEIVTVSIGKQIGYNSPKEGFGEVLRYLDNELQKLRDDYKGNNSLLKGKREYYTEVSLLMHSVNEAWRQRVAHMDTKYTEEEAIRIWDTTKLLMQQIAKGSNEDESQDQ